MLTVEEIAEFKEAYVKYKSGFNQGKRKGQPKLPKKDEVPDWTDLLLKSTFVLVIHKLIVFSNKLIVIFCLNLYFSFLN